MTKATKEANTPLITRSSALLLIEVNMANPNGDPDMDGRPRTFADGRGWITDASIKRKFRDALEDADSDVFITLQKELGLDPERCSIFESLNRGSGCETPIEAKRWAFDLYKDQGPEAFFNKYLDVRLMGCTALSENEKGESDEVESGKKKKTGNMAKKNGDKVNLKRTGVVTMTPAVSLCPVNIEEATISKKATLRDSLLETGQNDLAPLSKKFVQHGLYVARLSVNPHVAKHTFTTEEDIQIFKNVLKYIFSLSTCCTRPAGSVFFKHIWWADHTNSLGSFNEQEFFQLLTPKKKGDTNVPSQSIEDYEIPNPKELNLDYDVADLA